MKHNKLWHDSLHLIIIWPYQRIFAKFIFIFPDTQRPGYYATITVQFYMMKAQLYFVHDTFCLTNNLFILSRVMMTSSPLQLTVFVKTFEKMRTTYLDRMMAVWRVSDPWEHWVRRCCLSDCLGTTELSAQAGQDTRASGVSSVLLRFTRTKRARAWQRAWGNILCRKSLVYLTFICDVDTFDNEF